MRLIVEKLLLGELYTRRLTGLGETNSEIRIMLKTDGTVINSLPRLKMYMYDYFMDRTAQEKEASIMQFGYAGRKNLHPRGYYQHTKQVDERTMEVHGSI